MIKIYDYNKDSIEKVLSRSQLNDDKMIEYVNQIISKVKREKDKALFEYTLLYDKCEIDSNAILVSKEEIEKAYLDVDKELLDSLRKAIKNVYEYHLAHRQQDLVIEENGIKKGMLIRSLSKAGIYVPGGTAAYPSSVLMTALPAKAAGVKEVIMCSPNIKNPLTLVAAKECGVDKIYRIGGAQAIAALAYGTESVPKVDIIAGPGNIFVTLAKKLVFGDVKIDMIAGPSEILIIADESGKADFIASDLLSQAEHDKMSASIFITTSQELAERVKEELVKQTEKLSRKEIIKESLKTNGAIIVVDNVDIACKIANIIAPEHLELITKENIIDKIESAGAVFVGNYTTEPLGDYFAGPSHVLPTSGTAKYFEVLNADTFTKKMSYIEYNKDNLREVAKDVYRIAMCEGFDAHASTMSTRFKEIKE